MNVPLGIILLVLAVAYVPNSASQARRRLDVTGIVQLAIGLLGVMAAISFLGSATATPLSVSFVLPLVVGIAALLAFVRHAARARDPFVPMRLLRGRGFAVMNAINFFYGVAVLGVGTLVPLYAEQRYGISTLGAGTLLTARAVGMIAVAGLAVVLLRRTGYRWPMFVGFSVTALGLVLMAIAPSGVSPYVWLAGATAIAGIGMGTAIPASNNAMLNLAPESTASVAGLRGMFRQAGGITGVSIMTAVLARSADPGITQAHAFVLLAVVLMGLLPLIFRVPDHHGSW